MATMKKIVYILGASIPEDSENFVGVPIRDLVRFFEEEDGDRAHERIRNQLNGYKQLFVAHKHGGFNYYRLTARGRNYYKYLKDKYDPVSDTMLVMPAGFNKIDIYSL